MSDKKSKDQVKASTTKRHKNAKASKASTKSHKEDHTRIAENKTLRIVLRSYSYSQLDSAVGRIIEIASSTGAIISGPVPLPKRIRTDTVLSSPHIDKRARDQFHTITHKRLLDIKYASTATVDALVNLDLAAGVEVPKITII